MLRLILLMSFVSLAACGGNDAEEASDNAVTASAKSELSTTGLPLDMPMMRGAEILNPIKARSGGKIHEAVFKVKATPDDVAAFYRKEMLDRGYTLGDEYADGMDLSSWGENDEVLFSMKGVTNKRDTPESQQLRDDETRVLVIGKFKNME